MKKTVFLLTACMLLVLSACSTGGVDPVPAPGVTTLIYANLTEGGVDREKLAKFNRTHKDVQIEVQDYFDEDGTSGRQKLLMEIGAGKIPDIIDLRGGLPLRVLSGKGILEDLWPYIDNDPELGRNRLVTAPLEATEIDGKLYCILDDVSISTLVGAESVIGNRSGWTHEELMEIFASMPEDSTILPYWMDKNSVFHHYYRFGLDQYVDWETGECFFDSKAFRDSLEFMNRFPYKFDLAKEGGQEDLSFELADRVRTGRQLVALGNIRHACDLYILDGRFGMGSQAVIVGYPTSDGSGGSFFVPTKLCKILGMSSTCQNKEAAWEFIRQILLPKMDTEEGRYAYSGTLAIPINRIDYKIIKGISVEFNTGYEPIIESHSPTTAERNRFDDLVNSIGKIALYDSEIFNIAYENATAYFSGDKTLDETCDLIQRRVKLYVDEMR